MICMKKVIKVKNRKIKQHQNQNTTLVKINKKYNNNTINNNTNKANCPYPNNPTT